MKTWTIYCICGLGYKIDFGETVTCKCGACLRIAPTGADEVTPYCTPGSKTPTGNVPRLVNNYKPGSAKR